MAAGSCIHGKPPLELLRMKKGSREGLPFLLTTASAARPESVERPIDRTGLNDESGVGCDG